VERSGVDKRQRLLGKVSGTGRSRMRVRWHSEERREHGPVAFVCGSLDKT
jgi:hypothetical protein